MHNNTWMTTGTESRGRSSNALEIEQAKSSWTLEPDLAETRCRESFDTLDTLNEGSLTPLHFDTMLASAKLLTAEQDIIAVNSIEEAILAFNVARGRTQLGSKITFGIFEDMMLSTDLGEILDGELAEVLLLIRTVVQRQEMARTVARFSMCHTRDLEDVEDGQTTKDLKWLLDPVSFTVIIVNALLMGVQMDHSRWEGWPAVEYSFTLFFIIEIALKWKFYSVLTFFTGEAWHWNVLDFVLVALAVVDGILSYLGVDGNGLSMFLVLRLLRLVRVARLVRLLRFNAFKELVLILQGVIHGLRTLFWAIVLLFFVIYVVALVCRQTIGADDQIIFQERSDKAEDCSFGDSDCLANKHLQDNSKMMFGTVLGSCFTIFRCLTEGCTSPDGTPFTLFLYEASFLGKALTFCWVCVYLIVTFGLFNLIMSVFVENTMESARLDDKKRQKLRRNEHVMVARQLQKIVLRFCKNDMADRKSKDRPSMASETQPWYRNVFKRRSSASDVELEANLCQDRPQHVR
jgi:hypothetical protein